ncbi:sialate O-acetylesterase [Imperialibacter roseus]|uniref:Sialate O-acetylesterase n=1 Tax=Imperialibacter roseus TaxID=1324217 RepID=A0ABZ0IW48_9BACT|nr:sialate O-acetylesterase [Imperialibacter roseus]WOK08603.1 sialate O-acetylesterase [Imperialibacter roseus]
MNERHRHRIIVAVCLAACMVFAGQAMAQLSCAQLFSDNMVLQRGIEMTVWGTSAAGEKISVKLDGLMSSAFADEKGKWEVKLPAHEAGGPYQLEVEGVDEKLAFTNVLVGDVWFASGQSNMEHPVAGWEWIPHSAVNNYEEELTDTNYPTVRLFKVPKMPSPVELSDFEESAWQEASPGSVAGFSSTAWFFAKELSGELSVPIGVIDGSWGGTPIKSWMSRESASQFKQDLEIPPAPDDFNERAWRQAELISLDNTLARRLAISFPNEDDLSKTATEYNDTNWGVTNPLEEGTYYENVVWLRKEVQVPEKFTKGAFRLSLGFLNRESWIYLNGQELGFFLYSQPVEMGIPPGLIKPGKNVVTIRMAQPFGTTKFMGDADAYFLSTAKDKLSIPLAEDWRFKNEKLRDFGYITSHHNQTTYLYNGMVAPAIHYGIKGFIWYQGESDAGHAELYGEMFPSLITDWRKKWGLGELPFLFVQITTTEQTHEFSKPNSSWSYLRQVQKETLALPNTGMVVSIDLGDPYDVHPKTKREFGRRLALQALDVAYDKALVANGPSYESYSLDGNTVVVHFGEAIELKKNKVGLGASFEIAGEDGKFVSATGKVKGSDLHISSSEVSQPKAIRFDWSNDPEYYIINKAGLAASPFVLELNK